MTRLDRLRAIVEALDSAIAALDQARKLNQNAEFNWVRDEAWRWRTRITARLDTAERELMGTTASLPPPGYTLLTPTEADTWRDGDLWLTWSGTWEPASLWVGKPIRGTGARPNTKVSGGTPSAGPTGSREA